MAPENSSTHWMTSLSAFRLKELGMNSAARTKVARQVATAAVQNLEMARKKCDPCCYFRLHLEKDMVTEVSH